MKLETRADLEGVLHAGRTVALALAAMRRAVRAGVTTAAIDEVGGRNLARSGARSGAQLAYGFPGHSCISLNDEVVHGVPSATRVIEAGDLVKIDLAAEVGGYFADAAVTVEAGPPTAENQALIDCAESALQRALAIARHGTPVCELGHAIETEVAQWGFVVLRSLGSHGIGRSIHEPPSIPNFHDRSNPAILTEGMVITLEPAISFTSQATTGPGSDGWTIRTDDGCAAAHVEHTIIVGREQPVIATSASR